MSQEQASTKLPCQIRFTPYTTYYNSFFLLRTPVTVSGQLTEIGYSHSSEPTLNSHYPKLSVTFHSISSNLENVLKNYGVSHMSCFWCEQVPLFQVSFSSEYKLRKFLRSQQRVQSELATLFSAKLTEQVPSTRNIPTTVQTQLFLISPDAVKKGARVIAVTLENHSTCMTLWKESKLFDFTALFRVHRLDPSKFPQQGDVTLRDLVSELEKVTDWFHMGIHMGVPDWELMVIRLDHQDTAGRKTHMLRRWRELTSDPTWSAVVKALVGIRMISLAEKVALKYGVMVPSVINQQDTVLVRKVSPMEHQLDSRIQKMTQEVEVHDKKLTTIESLLGNLRKEKALAQSKHVRGKNILTTVHNKTKRLLHERREVKQQLKLKEKELQYFQSFQKQQEDKEDLSAIIEAKEAEIMQLRGSLDGLRQELESSQKEASSLREQLHQSTIELAEKSAHVQQLERTRADLMTILEGERRRVDQLLMQSAAAGMGKAVKEVECQLASAKEQYDSQFGETEIKSHQQAITQKDGEIRRLSKEVQTLEAQLQEVLQTENEVEEELHRLTVETLDLKVQLAEAEGEKLEAVRQLEGVQRGKRELEQWIEELEKKTMTTADPEKYTAVGSGVEVAETAQVAQAQPKFCMALYDYKSQRPDELNIHANEELEVLEWDNGEGWCRGRKQSGQVGYFPQNYVQQSTQMKMEDPQKCTAVVSGVEVAETAQVAQAQPKFCVALYDYKSQRPDELDIHANEELEVLEWDNGEGWCRGRKQSGQVGYFPQNHVQPSKQMEMEDPEKCTAVGSGVEVAETAQVAQAQPKFCVALYDYKSQRPDELDIHANEELEVLEWDNGEGWCRGRKQSGQEGYFPQNHVQPSKQMKMADPQKCAAVGSGVKIAETARIARFEVYLVDTKGHPCATTQHVTADLKSIVSGSVIEAKVMSKAPATYEVSYQPRVRGRHDLSVRVNGTPIQGSPFRVYVRQSPRLLTKPVRDIRGLKYRRMVITSNGEIVVCVWNELSVYTKDGRKIKAIQSVQSGTMTYNLNPFGVAIDGSGNMYVSDERSHRVFEFSSDGKLVKSVGGEGEKPGEFSHPDGIAVSEDNKVFVCDQFNHRIQIFDTDLNFISCFGTRGSGEGEFHCPMDLAIDSAGNLYVADERNHRIQVFSQKGTFLRAFGKHGPGPGKLGLPCGVHVDHDWVYVAEWDNSRVSVFTTSGEFITSFGYIGGSRKRGITTDEDGYVYVSDTFNHHIQVF